MNSIQWMVNQLTSTTKSFHITDEQYCSFKRNSIFKFIAGIPLGQAFCEYYDIGNASPLYHFKDDKISERWIRNNYIA
jgi:hypothetical protein